MITSLFLSLGLSAQKTTPATSADIQDINLRLDNYREQKAQGNGLIVAGIALNGLGALLIFHQNGNVDIGKGVMFAGGALSTTGVILNMTSISKLKRSKLQ